MTKILGLDLGTNSIGWAIINEKEAAPLLHKGVVIFQEGVKIEKGKEKSRAAERTAYRGARRIKFRRKLRKYETLKILAKNKMCPLSEQEVNTWRKSNFKAYPKNIAFLNWLKTDEKLNLNPYFFRDKFARSKQPWETDQIVAHQLGRAFYHIAQRRGFKSNRLEQSDENIISGIKDLIQNALSHTTNSPELLTELTTIFFDFDFDNRKKDELDTTEQKIKQIRAYIIKILANKVKNKDYSNFQIAKIEIDRYINKPENLGVVKGGIKTLTTKMEKNNCQTLGQYFWLLYTQDRTKLNHKIRTNYTARDAHYLHEFNIICNTQNINSSEKKELEKAIFFQRPLKSQKGLVGYCTLETAKPRCPLSRPEFEEFRMWSFINTIKIKRKSDAKLRSLTPEEKQLLIPKFLRLKPSFKFNDLAKALEQNSQTPFVYSRHTSNWENSNIINFKLDTTVSGCPTTAYLKQIMGDDWATKTYLYTIKKPNGQQTNKKANYTDIWHILFTYDSDEKLYEFAQNALNLEQKTAKKFAKKTLPQGYGNLSLKAINKIVPWLKKGLKYNHAVFMANIHKVVKPTIWKNKTDQESITSSIGIIIDNYGIEKKLVNAVNNLIADYRKEEHTPQYSKQAEPIIKEDLANKIDPIFGIDNWDSATDNNGFLFNKYFNKLITELEVNYHSPQFIILERLDKLIKEFLISNNLIQSEKDINKLFHPSDLENFKPINAIGKNGEVLLINNKPFKILGSPQTGSIKNPVLLRAMHQMRKLINTLLKQNLIDDKTRIHIELAREVNDANKRAAYKKWQDEKRNENEEIAQIIETLFKETGKIANVTADDIKKVKLWTEQLTDNKENPVDIFNLSKPKKVLVEKYKLWKEQNGICIYTGKRIGIAELFDGLSFDIEHTLPRSISWDNSMENKTIADAKFNRDIKRNKIPAELESDLHQKILQRIAHWQKRYLKLEKEINAINAAGIADKANKDRAIQKRHSKKFERDYWYNKYQRFVIKEVKQGFKNSQLVDTGLITRYAKTYLSSLFKNNTENPNVRIVKGSVVAEFRKSWGIQADYEKKSRKNHIHHCIDAITIACMTKPKYDAFVAAWRTNEEHFKHATKYAIATPKPWKTFTQDVLNIENEILVVRDFKDKTPIQAKKIVRKRGKIQYSNKLDKNGNKIPKYAQGDTARGSLHQDSFYGAIKQVERDENGNTFQDEDGKLILKKNKKGQDEITYVIRKLLINLKDADLSNIVDLTIQKICIAARKQEKILKKEIDLLKKELSNAENLKIESEIKLKMDAIYDTIEHKLYAIPPKQGKTVYTPIRKVRVKAGNIKEPLPNFKAHRNLSKHLHKQEYFVQNDSNYCLAIYENDAKTKRKSQIVNQITASTYFKQSNQAQKNNGKPLIKADIKGFKLKGLLKTNISVLFYKERPEEIWDLDKETLMKRLYFVRIMGKSGQTTFQHHQEARIDEQLKLDYEKEFNEKPPKSLTNGISKLDFDAPPAPKLLISPGNMTMLIQGVDFKLNVLGEIEQL